MYAELPSLLPEDHAHSICPAVPAPDRGRVRRRFDDNTEHSRTDQTRCTPGSRADDQCNPRRPQSRRQPELHLRPAPESESDAAHPESARGARPAGSAVKKTLRLFAAAIALAAHAMAASAAAPAPTHIALVPGQVSQNYVIAVDASTQALTITLNGTGGDLDLFVRYGTPFPEQSTTVSYATVGSDTLNHLAHS